MGIFDFVRPKSIYDVLHFINTAHDAIPEPVREHLTATVFDWTNKKDEAALEAALSHLEIHGIKGEDGTDTCRAAKNVKDWLGVLRANPDQKIRNQGHMFRKMVATHPDFDRRVGMIYVYGLESDNEARSKRLLDSNIEPWFIEEAKRLMNPVSWVKNIKDVATRENLEKALNFVSTQADPYLTEIEAYTQKRLKRWWWPF